MQNMDALEPSVSYAMLNQANSYDYIYITRKGINYSKFNQFAKSCSFTLSDWSAIIKKEFNYMLNPVHDDFRKLEIINKEEFGFDYRLFK